MARRDILAKNILERYINGNWARTIPTHYVSLSHSPETHKMLCFLGRVGIVGAQYRKILPNHNCILQMLHCLFLSYILIYVNLICRQLNLTPNNTQRNQTLWLKYEVHWIW